MTNPGVGFMIKENKVYDWQLQRGEAASDEVEYEVEYEEI